VVQFTTTEEYVKLVERAQALLSNTLPTTALEVLHLRAMQALVAELEKRKYAVSRPTERASCPADAPAQGAERAQGLELAQAFAQLPATEQAQALEQLPTTEQAQALEQLPATEQAQAFAQLPATEPLELPAQRGRYIPAATRRAVFKRDHGRCSYVDAFGQACRETHGLELHHLRAFARGGEHALDNLVLRCRAHNTLAAEEDFGRELIQRRRASPKHEPLAGQKR